MSVKREELIRFLDDLENLEIPKINIPKIKIPNWPPVEIQIDLGVHDWKIPIMQANGLVIIREGRSSLLFRVKRSGHFIFLMPKRHNRTIYGAFSRSSCSDADNVSNRLIALYLFNQLNGEIVLKLKEKIKKMVSSQNHAVREAQKAFELFLPHIVADKLSE